MNANNFWDLTVISQGVFSNILFNLFLLFIGFIHKDFKLFSFQLRDVAMLAVATKRIIYLAGLNTIFLLSAIKLLTDHSLYISIITSVILVLSYTIYVLFNCGTLLKRMGVAGISEVDDTVEDGISYKKSLELSDQSMRFLGIGAHKLTQLDEFRKAIEKSEQNSTDDKIFLICDPRSPALKKMEERNQQNLGNYKEKIIESLREIQKLKNQHYKIKVFLYGAEEIKDLPVFRLFFINADCVLVSFYAINKSNDAGKKLPQIKFSRTGPSSSFFYAFKSYFDNILSSSNECVDIDSLINSIR